MWTTIPAQEIDDTVKREVQFNTSPAFWADMLEKGAKYFRWDETENTNGSKTAGEIVNFCHKSRDAPQLSILLEMEKGSRVNETTAHLILTEEMRKRLERERRALMEEEEEMRRLQQEKAELEGLVGREQEYVRRELEELERVEESSRSVFSTRSEYAQTPGLISSLASLTAPPLQRRFSDSMAGAQVWDARRGGGEGGGERYRVVNRRDRDGKEWERDMERDRDERSERDRDYEREQDRRDGRRRLRRSSKPKYEWALVRSRR